MKITGILEQHRIEVDAFSGARVNRSVAEFRFRNRASKCGETVVRIPVDRLSLTLGSDLAHWFLLYLEQNEASNLEPQPGELVEASDLIQIQAKTVRDARTFELMFADRDDESVTVAMPESEAIATIGERLYNRLLERGEIVRLRLLRRINGEPK